MIDETEFKSLVSDMGIAINTQKIRANSILVVMDEFFAAPSDLTTSAPTKDTVNIIIQKELKCLKPHQDK